eukprot:21915-Pelagococcus_subviridis.AAC.2
MDADAHLALGLPHHPPSHRFDPGQELVPLELLVELFRERVVRRAPPRLLHRRGRRRRRRRRRRRLPPARASSSSSSSAPDVRVVVAVRARPRRRAEHRAVSHRGAADARGGAAERAEERQHRPHPRDARCELSAMMQSSRRHRLMNSFAGAAWTDERARGTFGSRPTSTPRFHPTRRRAPG